MPTKRTRAPRPLAARITPAAVEAFGAGRWLHLHRALRLRPWEVSPLDAAAEQPAYPTHGWQQARELRRELES